MAHDVYYHDGALTHDIEWKDTDDVRWVKSPVLYKFDEEKYEDRVVMDDEELMEIVMLLMASGGLD